MVMATRQGWRTTRREFLKIAAGGLVALGAFPRTAGAAALSAPRRQAGEKVLRIAWNAPPPNFNPLLAVSATQDWIFKSTMSTLTRPDPVAKAFAGDLAESWEVAPDGSSYTFKLRQNAKWHDGTPVTARDVAFTYTTALNPATGSKLTGRFALIKGAAAYTEGKADSVAGINVIDDHTIRFDMEFPNGLFLYETTSGPAPWAILPQHILGSLKPEDMAKHPYFSEALVGSGPFKFVKYVPDQYLEVEANPDYHFGRPKIDRIVFNIIKSPDTIQVAMDRGEIDMPVFDGGTATTEMFKHFLETPNFKIIGTQGTTLITYFVNFRHDYLRDERIHQAMLYALDRKKLVERFNAGNGTIVNSFMVHSWYQKPEWANLYPYDPPKARALLQEANWDSNREVGVNVITLANEEIRAMLAAEQQMFADVGFKVSFKEMELPVWVEKFYDTHDFELARVTAGAFPDPDGFLSFHMKTGSKNALGYANPELDKKIEQGRRTIDQAERARIYQEINEEMLRTVPAPPVYLQNAWWIMNRRWSVPALDPIPPATSLTDVPIAPIFVVATDYWGYRMQEWDLTA